MQSHLVVSLIFLRQLGSNQILARTGGTFSYALLGSTQAVQIRETFVGLAGCTADN